MMIRAAVSALALALLLGAPARAEVMVDGMPCHDYLTKVEAKLAACSNVIPTEMRPVIELGFMPIRGVLSRAAKAVKEQADGDDAKVACEGIALSVKDDARPMNLDAPGCD